MKFNGVEQVNVGASPTRTMDTLYLLGDGIRYNDDACAIVFARYSFSGT